MWIATDDALMNLDKVAEIRQEDNKVLFVWETGEFQSEVAFSDYGRASQVMRKCISLLSVKEEL